MELKTQNTDLLLWPLPLATATLCSLVPCPCSPLSSQGPSVP